MSEEKIFTEKQKMLINCLSDGMVIEEAKALFTSAPYLVPGDKFDQWIRDPELLKKVIDKSNDLIGQAWGTMWREIKNKAMLGSIQHAKLLIEFVQNGKKLADNRLRLIFEDSVSGGAKDENEPDEFAGEGVTSGY